MLQLTDLFAVYKLTNDIIIFVRKEDIGKPSIQALKIIRPTKEYHFTKLELFLKFGAFEPIHTNCRPTQKFYRSLFYRSFPEEKLFNILNHMEKF
jgi:hypothetical protein